MAELLLRALQTLAKHSAPCSRVLPPAVLLCALSTAGCATSATSSLQQRFKEDEQRFEERAIRYRGCSNPFIQTRGVITGLNNSARSNLRVGDRIVSIDGKPYDTDEAAVEAEIDREPGKGAIRLVVARSNTEATIDVPCLDEHSTIDPTRKVLEAGVAGRWSDCVRLTWELEEAEDLIPPAAKVAFWRRDCALSLANVEGRPVGSAEATFIYEAQRRAIRDAALVPDELEQIRGNVLVTIQTLQPGFPVLANDVRRVFNSAAGFDVGPGEASATQQVSGGTCFAVAPDGLILTAHHVVNAASKISVRVGSGTSYPATLQATSSQSDLVLLRVPAATPEFLPLAKPQSVRLGEHVFTVGFPLPQVLGSEPKFTEGSVSALSGPQGNAEFLQVSVPVQPGNSGGPLVNDAGEVVGIVTSTAAVLPLLKATGTAPQNINWALRSELATAIVPQQSARAKAVSRDDAIARTRRAVCYVESVSNQGTQ